MAQSLRAGERLFIAADDDSLTVVANSGPDVVYYGDDGVSASSYVGSIAAGDEVSLAMGRWFTSAGLSVLALAFFPYTNPNPAGPAAETSYVRRDRSPINVRDYITGAETAALQTAGLQAAITAAGQAKRPLVFVSPSSGTTEYLIDAALTVSVPTVIEGNGVTIRQTVWGDNTYHFDAPATQHFDVLKGADGTVIDGFNLTFTGNRIFFINTGIGSYRDDQPYAMASAISVSANRCLIRNIRGEGRQAVVKVQPWDLVAHARVGYVEDTTIENIIAERCDFGVLIDGVNNCSINNVRGSYSAAETQAWNTAVPGNWSPPPHLVYVSNKSLSRNVTGANWIAEDGGALITGHSGEGGSHAYSIKGITGGTFTNLQSRGCEGLVTVQECEHIKLSNLSGMADVGTASSTVSWSTSDVYYCEFDNVSVEHAVQKGAVNMNGTENTIRGLMVETPLPYNASGDHVTVQGQYNLIDGFRFRCTHATQGARPLGLAGTGNNRVNVAAMRNVRRVAALGSSGSVISYDPADIILQEGFSTLVQASVSTGHVRRAPHRKDYTVSGAGTTTPDATSGSLMVLTVTTAAAFTIGAAGSYGASMRNEVDIEIFNNSGGALGAITWNAAYLFAGGSAPAAPASGKRLRVRFLFDGTNWLEADRVSLP